MKKTSLILGFLAVVSAVVVLFFPFSPSKTPPPDKSDLIRAISEFGVASMELPNREKISVLVANTPQLREQGLSGIKKEEFRQDGMIFLFERPGPRMFWMPDTYFDLDIFFLDTHLTIMDVDRGVPHHPGRNTPPPIAKTRTLIAHHILELPSSSTHAKSLDISDPLKLENGFIDQLKKSEH